MTSARSNYDAIVFDVGGTLFDVAPDPQRRALRAIAHLGAVSPADYAAGVRRARTEWVAAGGTADKEDLAGTWISHNARALELASFAGDIHLAARLIEESFLADGWEVFADVHDTLGHVQRLGLAMAVVSNWPASLEMALEQAALRKYFDVVVASGVVGYAKPHPQIFRIAAEQLDLAPHCALYVGDSVEHDVKGATAAGMDVVLLRRDGSCLDRVRCVRSLADLLDLL